MTNEFEHVRALASSTTSTKVMDENAMSKDKKCMQMLLAPIKTNIFAPCKN